MGGLGNQTFHQPNHPPPTPPRGSGRGSREGLERLIGTRNNRFRLLVLHSIFERRFGMIPGHPEHPGHPQHPGNTEVGVILGPGPDSRFDLQFQMLKKLKLQN